MNVHYLKKTVGEKKKQQRDLILSVDPRSNGRGRSRAYRGGGHRRRRRRWHSGVGFERAAALGLNGTGEVDGEERLSEASPKGVVASGVGGGGTRRDGGGSRRSSDSGEDCARLREAMAAPVGGKRGRGPGRLYLWRRGAARCVEEGARRGWWRHGGDGDGVAARDSVSSSGTSGMG